MTDLSITAANVLASEDATFASGVAGEAVTAGQAGYRDRTTGKYMKADSNSASSDARRATCIFLNSAAADQPVKVQKSGEITIGATLSAGTPYFLSDTPGGICPFADIGTGEYVCQIGIAKSTSVLLLLFAYPDVSL